MVIAANLSVDPNVSGTLTIDGPVRVDGDFIVDGTTQPINISSTSIRSIAGAVRLRNIPHLELFNLQALESVGALHLRNISQPKSFSLGSNTARIDLIEVYGTSIETLPVFNSTTLNRLSIANNANLINVSLPVLQSIQSDISIFSNGNLTKISFPLLNIIEDGVLSVVSNENLVNISLPTLHKIGGSITIRNNTPLEKIRILQLEQVGGAIVLRGNFDEYVSTQYVKDY